MATLAIDPTSQFARNLSHYAGRKGETWLQQLPATINALAHHWHLTNIEPFNNLSFHFVAQARQAGRQVVLKVGWDAKAINREIFWLSHFEQHTPTGVVPILAQDKGKAYLMQTLQPGFGLNQVSEEQATEVIGQCIKGFANIQAPIPQQPVYPTTQDWFAQLSTATDASKQRLGQHIDRASSISRELSPTTDTRLLHGDLHHANLLKDQGRWVVTDPQGVIGDPAHECAAMLRNALELIAGDRAKGIQRRVAQLASATGYDARRIASWGYAQNVLSCVWSLDADPNADISAAIEVVEALQHGS